MLDLTESKNIAQKVEIYEKKQRNISNNNEIKNYGDNCQISNNVIQSNRNSSNADIIKLIKKLVPAFILKKFGWN